MLLHPVRWSHQLLQHAEHAHGGGGASVLASLGRPPAEHSMCPLCPAALAGAAHTSPCDRGQKTWKTTAAGASCMSQGLCRLERMPASEHVVGAQTVPLVNGRAALGTELRMLEESVFVLESKCFRNRDMGFLNLALAPSLP